MAVTIFLHSFFRQLSDSQATRGLKSLAQWSRPCSKRREIEIETARCTCVGFDVPAESTCIHLHSPAFTCIHLRLSQVYSMDPELPAEVIDAVFKAPGKLRPARKYGQRQAIGKSTLQLLNRQRRC